MKNLNKKKRIVVGMSPRTLSSAAGQDGHGRKRQTVVVGMSGGVDSSVTAAILKKQGYKVLGVFMKNWSQDIGAHGCTWAEDSEEARKVAQVLDIPFYVWDFEKEYYKKVVEYFFREYKAGRTPNPDVMCNKEIKFKIFLDKAIRLGADFVATGHYAQNVYKAGQHHLLKATDISKEQSYFLYTLNQDQLSRVLFPIGGYKKTEVRKLAKKFRLPNYDRKDSQGICFIGQINVTEFLRKHIKAKPGDIVLKDGTVLGRHFGLPFYTIGQREGMGLGGQGPYYVVAKNQRKNRLVVSNDPKDPGLWRKEFIVSEMSWVGKAPKFPASLDVTIRYHHPEEKARISKLNNKEIKIVFNKPQRAITPGQCAVIYRKNELVGGGIIKAVK
jgi:tRNA-uridine 2-sulfurtransferase